jgi:hypothetical protein
MGTSKVVHCDWPLTSSKLKGSQVKQKNIVPLEHETRSAVTTAAAAHYLCREEQTLRIWACRENGPIHPFRLHGRLAWPVCEIRRLLRLNEAGSNVINQNGPNSTSHASRLEGTESIEIAGARFPSKRPGNRP